MLCASSAWALTGPGQLEGDFAGGGWAARLAEGKLHPAGFDPGTRPPTPNPDFVDPKNCF